MCEKDYIKGTGTRTHTHTRKKVQKCLPKLRYCCCCYYYYYLMVAFFSLPMHHANIVKKFSTFSTMKNTLQRYTPKKEKNYFIHNNNKKFHIEGQLATLSRRMEMLTFAHSFGTAHSIREQQNSIHIIQSHKWQFTHWKIKAVKKFCLLCNATMAWHCCIDAGVLLLLVLLLLMLPFD